MPITFSVTFFCSEESATLPDSGITLYPPENDEIETEEQMQCTLTAVCKNPPYNMNITAVDILSSAKTIEVCNQIFSKIGIYQYTFQTFF